MCLKLIKTFSGNINLQTHHHCETCSVTITLIDQSLGLNNWKEPRVVTFSGFGAGTIFSEPTTQPNWPPAAAPCHTSPHPYSCGCILLLNCPNLPLTSLHLHCILQHTVLEQNNIATHIHPQHTTFFFYRYFRSPFLKRSFYFITKYLHLQKYKHPNAPTNSLAFSSTT